MHGWGQGNRHTLRGRPGSRQWFEVTDGFNQFSIFLSLVQKCNCQYTSCCSFSVIGLLLYAVLLYSLVYNVTLAINFVSALPFLSDITSVGC